ncbi:hypothetical protein DEJ25_12730 [Curtobacterium sp. MCPF17_011]|uniref:hypothetical protein n=1 Tax=Curtobacterium sp. MCPF17_011 TaxID=2175652 RepID=UPI000DAA9BE1|nr:hypothetical protein [Curtobacterium sp. MCPF17_011]PZF10683.1 hypothetical protein DEJ25_12730 [Curtobacterium sp. MCPF17_011]
MPSLEVIAAVVDDVLRNSPAPSVDELAPATAARVRAEATRRGMTPAEVIAEGRRLDREEREATLRAERIASRARRAYRESGTRRTVYTGQA